MKMSSLSGNIHVVLNLIDFVDDTSSVKEAKRDDTVQDLLRKIQEEAQLWHNLRWFCGMNLEL